MRILQASSRGGNFGIAKCSLYQGRGSLRDIRRIWKIGIRWADIRHCTGEMGVTFSSESRVFWFIRVWDGSLDRRPFFHVRLAKDRDSREINNDPSTSRVKSPRFRGVRSTEQRTRRRRWLSGCRSLLHNERVIS